MMTKAGGHFWFYIFDIDTLFIAIYPNSENIAYHYCIIPDLYK